MMTMFDLVLWLKKADILNYVSDEQLEAYARLSLLERLRWVDEMRLFTLMASTPEITERRERLRRGELIVDVSQEKDPSRPGLDDAEI